MEKKIENIRAMKVEASNGSVIAVHVDDDEDVFVFSEEDFDEDATEAQKWADFLYALTTRFFNPHNKYSNDDVNINIYLAPGHKSEVKNHVRAFLKDLLHEPTQEVMDEVSAVIEKHCRTDEE